MALRGETKAWANHPVVKAWRGYEWALVQYAIAICKEWRQRGYKDTVLDYFTKIETVTTGLPQFVIDPEVNRMYRCILTHKNSEWYGQFWDEEPLEKCDYELLK